MRCVIELVNEQAEFFGLVWQPLQRRFRLRANDLIRIGCRLCRVIRVSECAAVVHMNRPPFEFKTRFDKQVRLEPSPVKFRISANSETEILNRNVRTQKKRK